jgi:hypothetical protein
MEPVIGANMPEPGQPAITAALNFFGVMKYHTASSLDRQKRDADGCADQLSAALITSSFITPGGIVAKGPASARVMSGGEQVGSGRSQSSVQSS